jgi:hypothetical protein
VSSEFVNLLLLFIKCDTALFRVNDSMNAVQHIQHVSSEEAYHQCVNARSTKLHVRLACEF